MVICEHCAGQVETATAIWARCPYCYRWSEEILLTLLQHADAAIRGNAAASAIFVSQNERLIRALAVALCDQVISVRRDAGVALFICGQKAAIAVPEVIEALNDQDLIERRLAAACLSMIGPQALAAMPHLLQMRDDDDELLRVWVAAAIRSLTGR